MKKYYLINLFFVSALFGMEKDQAVKYSSLDDLRQNLVSDQRTVITGIGGLDGVELVKYLEEENKKSDGGAIVGIVQES